MLVMHQEPGVRDAWQQPDSVSDRTDAVTGISRRHEAGDGESMSVGV